MSKKTTRWHCSIVQQKRVIFVLDPGKEEFTYNVAIKNLLNGEQARFVFVVRTHVCIYIYEYVFVNNY